MVAGIVDQAGVFISSLEVERESRFLHQHPGKADNGVQRRPQFVTHGSEEAALGGVGSLGFGARLPERFFLAFSFGHVAQHGDDFAAIMARGFDLFKRPATHLDPDKLRHRVAVGRITPHPEFNRSALAQRRSIAKRSQIGRPVGDMDAVEQALSL